MKLAKTLRKLDKDLERLVDHGTSETRAILRNVGWVSAGITALAIGVVVGRELRERYKFNRRTPYDMYSHAGADGLQDVEFGVGV